MCGKCFDICKNDKKQIKAGASCCISKKKGDGPNVCVMLYKDKDGKTAPCEATRSNGTSLWRMDILRGTHTAVVLTGAKDLEIKSNNPANAVPMSSDVWVDVDKNSDCRTLLFHGRRRPKKVPSEVDNAARQANDHCSLFEYKFGKSLRTVLQVWVHDYPKHYVFIRLFGRVLATNHFDLPEYKFPDSPLEAIPTHYKLSAENYFGMMVNRINKCGGVEHLVINAHGGFMADKEYIKNGHVCVGKEPYLYHGNIDLWDQLRGKVKYIWLLNCTTGSDNVLCAKISYKTGAWVSAPDNLTGYKPITTPKGHIEYYNVPTVKHFKWDLIVSNGPKYSNAAFPTPDDCYPKPIRNKDKAEHKYTDYDEDVKETYGNNSSNKAVILEPVARLKLSIWETYQKRLAPHDSSATDIFYSARYRQNASLGKDALHFNLEKLGPPLPKMVVDPHFGF